MKPAPFRYVAPDSLDAALALLAEHGDGAKALAGGQSLLAMMNLRLAQPSLLVDLAGCGLDGLSENGTLMIGATVTQAAAMRSETVVRRAPLLVDALRHVGHEATRTRGTVGGSAAHADPAAEIPAVLLALDARLHVSSTRGARTIPADQFYVTHYTTVLEPDEVVTAIELPATPTAWGFAEAARRHGDFALAGCAAAFTADGPRVALFGIADKPVRSAAAEAALAGTEPGDSAAARLAAAAVADLGLTPERRRLAETVVERALSGATRGDA